MFRDRRDAGRQLAALLIPLDLVNPIVIALPRGGVPVGREVAEALGAPLDVLVARKLGAPHQPEFGIGAVAEGGVVVLTDGATRALGLTDRDLGAVRSREEAELARRVDRYRGSRPMVQVEGRTVVLVDDGLATGVTAAAAIESLRARDLARLVLATPVCAPDTARRLAPSVDDLVTVLCPSGFRAVGQFYDRFDQVTDAEVIEILTASGSARSEL